MYDEGEKKYRGDPSSSDEQEDSSVGAASNKLKPSKGKVGHSWGGGKKRKRKKSNETGTHLTSSNMIQ
jgi:hypothetical protein